MREGKRSKHLSHLSLSKESSVKRTATLKERVLQLPPELREPPMTYEYARGFLSQMLYFNVAKSTISREGDTREFNSGYVTITAQSTNREKIAQIEALFPNMGIVTDHKDKRGTRKKTYFWDVKAEYKDEVLEILMPDGNSILPFQGRILDKIAKIAHGEINIPDEQTLQKIQKELADLKDEFHNEPVLPSVACISGMFDAGLGGINFTPRATGRRDDYMLQVHITGKLSGLQRELQRKFGGGFSNVESRKITGWAITDIPSLTFLRTIYPHLYFRKKLTQRTIAYLEQREDLRRGKSQMPRDAKPDLITLNDRFYTTYRELIDAIDEDISQQTESVQQ